MKSNTSFITIAQQIGAESDSLPARLAARLSQSDPGITPWSHWDRELVKRVSVDNRIPARLIKSLDTTGHSWIGDLLDSGCGHVDEEVIFSGIQKAVRDLACAGRVILVGHGSTYMTHDLPGGLHVRLVAPMDHRIKNVAKRFNLSSYQAARHMHRVDKTRQRFVNRFWPRLPLAPEIFTAVFNTAELEKSRLIGAIMALAHGKRGIVP